MESRVCRAAGACRKIRRTGAPPSRFGGAVHRPALLPGSRSAGAHLRHAGLGAQHRGRARRPARPRLCRVLCGRRLLVRIVFDHLRPRVLDVPADCGRARGPLGRSAGVSGAAAARRLPRHRHVGIRRDYPNRDRQLGFSDQRAERHFRHPASDPVRPHLLAGRRGGQLFRLFRFVTEPDLQGDFSVLRHPRNGAADQLGDLAAAADAARARLGGVARG